MNFCLEYLLFKNSVYPGMYLQIVERVLQYESPVKIYVTVGVSKNNQSRADKQVGHDEAPRRVFSKSHVEVKNGIRAHP